MTKKETNSKKVKKEQLPETNNPNKTLHEEAHKEFEKNQSAYGAEDMDYKLENNEVYDDADLASALESSMLSKALKDHKQKMAPQKHPNFDGIHCLDCEDEMHPDRLKMGRIRCTDCQEHQEYLEKRKGSM